MTYDRWDTLNRHMEPCLEARDIQWVRSLVSRDGYRSMCELEVPYAEAVREACCEAREPFNQVWQVEIWAQTVTNNAFPDSCLVVAEMTYDPPTTKPAWESLRQKARPCFVETDVQGLMTFMTIDGRRSVCLLSASDADTVRSSYRKAGILFESIWRVDLIMPK